jgi:hypothetical protein
LCGFICWWGHGGVHLRTCSLKFQWYQQMSWDAKGWSGVLRRWVLECKRLRVCDASSEATWHVSSSIRSRNLAVLSGVLGDVLTVVDWMVTSQILSARWEVESRLPTVWQASIACTCGGRRLVQILWRKSSGRPVLDP